MKELNQYYKPQELKWFNIIGWYQIVGGVFGVVFLLWIFAQNISLLVGLVTALGLSLNGYSVLAGRQLVKHRIFRPTYFAQAIQIINFIGLGITYQVVIGLALGVGFEWIDSVEIVANFKLFSLYEFKYKPSQTDAIRVVVNFVPILIINYLMKRKEEAKERKRLAQYSSASV